MIDCGANRGKWSTIFADLGAQVIAFEPDPVAFKALEESARGRAGMHVRNSAAGVSDGTVRLYFHTNRDANPLDYSSGSSLLESKPNVSSEFTEVTSIDLSRVVTESSLDVEILKIDIEGYEVELLPHLISTGAIDKIRKVFVETHEKKWPDLELATRRLIKLADAVEARGATEFHFDWP